MNPTRFVPKHPQVKICGLTHPEEAVGCVELGADAIGCVFYPPSPRHLEQHQARDISLAVAQHAVIVGVFVNASVEDIMATVERCHLTAVQLHGREAPEVVQKLRQAGLTVVKALFVDGTPPLTAAGDYRASAFLIECAKGALPGGNALTWRWDRARSFGFNHPLILAGGGGYQFRGGVSSRPQGFRPGSRFHTRRESIRNHIGSGRTSLA